MKLLFESNIRGWVNFGTKEQKYVIPHRILVGSTGKIWQIQNNRRTIVKSQKEFYQTKKQINTWTSKPATEQEIKEIYSI